MLKSKLINLDNNSITDDLQLKDKERLKKRSQQIASQYDDYEISIDNYKEGKAEKRLVNKAIRSANRLRIDKTKSLKQREKKLKSDLDDVLKPLQNVSNDLSEQINDVDSAMQDKRREKVSKVVHEMCSSRSMEDIEINPKWTEKSLCKRNGEPNSKGIELIYQQIKVEQANNDRIEIGSDYLKSQAKKYSLEPSGFINDFKKNPDHDNLKAIAESIMTTAQKRKLKQQKREEQTALFRNRYVNKNTGEVEDKKATKIVSLSGRQKDIKKLHQYANQLGIEWRNQ